MKIRILNYLMENTNSLVLTQNDTLINSSHTFLYDVRGF